jgi:hypothetical protein
LASLLRAGAILAASLCAAQEKSAAPEQNAAPEQGAAQEQDPVAQQHPWGRFPVGSWKSVRVVTETLDEKGQVAGETRTETRTKLVGADASGYSLLIESTVEVAGKRFMSQPQVVKHGYYGEPVGQSVTVKKLGAAELQIDGRTLPSDVRQATFESDGLKRVSTIHYSSAVSPYQLRRETVIEAATEAQRSTTLVETVALEMPQKVHGQVRPAAYLKTTRKTPQGTKVTLEIHCDDVPGGVVSHSANETDASGRVIRRSTLELIDYEIGGHPPSADPITRRRAVNRGRPRRMN